MHVRIISDVHLEFLSYLEMDILINNILCLDLRDVLVLAGDIGSPTNSKYIRFLQKMSENFVKVFVINGNHEYYDNTIEYTNKLIKNICEQFTNVVFLNNTSIEYKGYTWIGATLWSNLTNPLYLTNDMNYIKNLNIETYNNMHIKDKNFIKDTIDTLPNDTKIIIITHFLPSYSLISKKYIGNPYNQCFASDVDEMFTKDNIKLWIYGHTHIASDICINNIRLVCNPIGYKDENVKINYQKTIQL